MKVVEAAHEVMIEPSVVYIAPPNKLMLVSGGLTSSDFVHFSRPSIDLMFESLAAVFGDKAIGVILSGTGMDGSMGIKDVTECKVLKFQWKFRGFTNRLKMNK